MDDDATILLTYPDAEGIIQASWDWPYSIKDLEVFGEKGYYHAANERQLFNKMRGDSEPKLLPVQDAPGNDPVSCLAAMIQGQHPPGEALSSLTYNLVVMEILDAAKRSAKSGKTIKLN